MKMMEEMKMKPINNFEKVQVFTEIEKLPVGGYIIGITGAEEIEYSWGSVLEIKFDIAEGEFKNYYTNQYKNTQIENAKYKGTYRMNVPKDDGSDMDEWTTRIFKSNIVAIEESNNNFHWAWDEKQLVGKKVGAIFFEKEWEFDGKTGYFTTLHSLRSVQNIKDGKYKIPKPKMLKNKTTETSSIVEIDNLDDLPF